MEDIEMDSPHSLSLEEIMEQMSQVDEWVLFSRDNSLIQYRTAIPAEQKEKHFGSGFLFAEKRQDSPEQPQYRAGLNYVHIEIGSITGDIAREIFEKAEAQCNQMQAEKKLRQTLAEESRRKPILERMAKKFNGLELCDVQGKIDLVKIKEAIGEMANYSAYIDETLTKITCYLKILQMSDSIELEISKENGEAHAGLSYYERHPISYFLWKLEKKSFLGLLVDKEAEEVMALASGEIKRRKDMKRETERLHKIGLLRMSIGQEGEVERDFLYEEIKMLAVKETHWYLGKEKSLTGNMFAGDFEIYFGICADSDTPQYSGQVSFEESNLRMHPLYSFKPEEAFEIYGIGLGRALEQTRNEYEALVQKVPVAVTAFRENFGPKNEKLPLTRRLGR